MLGPVMLGPGPGSPPFNNAFFLKTFGEGKPFPQAPVVSVVELVLINGEVVDVQSFQEIGREYLIVSAFEDAPHCTRCYQTYLRYETILRINVRQAESDRRLGFLPVPTRGGDRQDGPQGKGR